MTLTDISNHRTNTEDKFQQFIECYEGDQPNVITALADKMYHMCFHIGSPVSIPGMLSSIVDGKVKRWSTGRSDDDKYEQGKQLKGMSLQHISRKCGVFNYKTDKDGKWLDDMVMTDTGFIQGHFRWNWGAYTVDRDTRHYIHSFWFCPNYQPAMNDEKNRIRDIQGTPSVWIKGFGAREYKLTLQTRWHRWEYTIDDYNGEERFHTNIGSGEVRAVEKKTMRGIMKSERKAKRIRIDI